MNVSCTHCQAVFRVDPEKIPAAGVRARCSNCSGVFPLTRASAEAARARDPAGLGQWRLGDRHRRRARAARPATVAAPAAPAKACSPARRLAPRRCAQSDAGGGSGRSVRPPAAPAAPCCRVRSRQRLQRPRARLRQHRRQRLAIRPAALRRRQPQPRRHPAAAPGAGDASSAGKRPVSVFGSQDPNARAQRLARALVSDIIAYHPERREKSLQAGTLRAEFKDEIMKSWEEYVAQVGQEIAKSTPYFRNALNEILAQGQKLF